MIGKQKSRPQSAQVSTTASTCQIPRVNAGVQLGRKTMEGEILKEALAKAQPKKPNLHVLSLWKDDGKNITVWHKALVDLIRGSDPTDI